MLSVVLVQVSVVYLFYQNTKLVNMFYRDMGIAFCVFYPPENQFL